MGMKDKKSTELRGIPACTFCIQYDWNEKKCKLGCRKEKETDYFCKDCPLPKVVKGEMQSG